MNDTPGQVTEDAPDEVSVAGQRAVFIPSAYAFLATACFAVIWSVINAKGLPDGTVPLMLSVGGLIFGSNVAHKHFETRTP